MADYGITDHLSTLDMILDETKKKEATRRDMATAADDPETHVYVADVLARRSVRLKALIELLPHLESMAEIFKKAPAHGDIRALAETVADASNWTGYHDDNCLHCGEDVESVDDHREDCIVKTAARVLAALGVGAA